MKCSGKMISWQSIRAGTVMMPEDRPDVKPGIRTDILDLTDLTLSDLEEVRPASLRHALRRVVAQDEDPADPVVGFQASI